MQQPYRVNAHHLTLLKAAQMMSQGSRPPRTSSARPDYNKPPPAVPGAHHSYRPEERYGGGRPSSYDARPPPGAYNDRYDSRYNDHQRPSVGSPPPANYGQGPPPQSYHGRSPISQQQRPPPTPAPPRDANDREALWRLFGAVDKDGRLCAMWKRDVKLNVYSERELDRS